MKLLIKLGTCLYIFYIINIYSDTQLNRSILNNFARNFQRIIPKNDAQFRNYHAKNSIQQGASRNTFSSFVEDPPPSDNSGDTDTNTFQAYLSVRNLQQPTTELTHSPLLLPDIPEHVAMNKNFIYIVYRSNKSKIYRYSLNNLLSSNTILRTSSLSDINQLTTQNHPPYELIAAAHDNKNKIDVWVNNSSLRQAILKTAHFHQFDIKQNQIQLHSTIGNPSTLQFDNFIHKHVINYNNQRISFNTGTGLNEKVLYLHLEHNNDTYISHARIVNISNNLLLTGIFDEPQNFNDFILRSDPPSFRLNLVDTGRNVIIITYLPGIFSPVSPKIAHIYHATYDTSFNKFIFIRTQTIGTLSDTPIRLLKTFPKCEITELENQNFMCFVRDKSGLTEDLHILVDSALNGTYTSYSTLNFSYDATITHLATNALGDIAIVYTT